MKLRHTLAKLKQDNIGSKHDKAWTNPALSRTNQGIYSKPDLIIHSSYFNFFFYLKHIHKTFQRFYVDKDTVSVWLPQKPEKWKCVMLLL